MSDPDLFVHTDEVFHDVGMMRSAFHWSGMRVSMEAPEVGHAAATDAVWRLVNLVRNLHPATATQLEVCAKSIVEGAIDAHMADEYGAEMIDVPTGTSIAEQPSSSQTTVVAYPATGTVTDTGTTTTTSPPTTTVPSE